LYVWHPLYSALPYIGSVTGIPAHLQCVVHPVYAYLLHITTLKTSIIRTFHTRLNRIDLLAAIHSFSDIHTVPALSCNVLK